MSRHITITDKDGDTFLVPIERLVVSKVNVGDGSDYWVCTDLMPGKSAIDITKEEYHRLFKLLTI